MDVPELVREAVADEDVVGGVSLGEEDVVAFTPTRTILYRGEGLLSDESVTEFPHEFERLSVSDGRRKTKLTFTYVDSEDGFAVPPDRTDAVLSGVLAGYLRAQDLVGRRESVDGVYRFSELTVVITQGRLLKHVGEYTWDGDFEQYPFDEVRRLAFEDGSVATSVVLETERRSERIKVPSDKAPSLRATLEDALFAFHDVGSLEELNEALAPEDVEPDDADELSLESGIDPLVDERSDDEDERGAQSEDRTGGRGARDDGGARGRSDDANDVRTETAATGRSSDAVAPDEERRAPADRREEARSSQQREGARSSEQREGARSSEQREEARNAEQREQARSSEQRGSTTPSGPRSQDRGSSRDGETAGQGEPARDGTTGDRSGREDGSGANEAALTKADVGALVDEVAALRATVERQGERIDRQEKRIAQLVEELRQGR